MLEWIFDLLGFWGTVFASLTAFILFIFWIAGMAGISDSDNVTDYTKTVKMVLSIVFPPYPVIWLIIDMIQHNKRLKSDN
jgi:hypothetical protein